MVLKNGVIALRDLELSESAPPKHNPEVEPLFVQLLLWGQAYTLFTMVMCGKDLPVEKVRDEELRLCTMYARNGKISAAEASVQFVRQHKQSIQREGLHWSLAAS